MNSKTTGPDLSIPATAIVVSDADDYDITPARGLYLVELCAADKTPAGLHIPESAQQGKMPKWRVLAAGPGLLLADGTLVPPLHEVGDQVLTSPAAGKMYEFPEAGIKRALVEEQAILGSVRHKGAEA